MRMILLTSLTMVAFAMNSILNRAAVEGGHADPAAFAMIRVVAGVVVLGLILMIRGGRLEFVSARRWGGGFSLAVYMIGFSLAYLSLDAGLGALILFGTVQIVLFVHSALTGTPPNSRQITGAGLAFLGLSLALWPSEGAQSGWAGAVYMLIAGIGWAFYTLAGRGADKPVAATASHFLLSLPFLAVLLFQPELSASFTGWVLAIVGGGVTSGLGYALWYHVLPSLPGVRAAIIQLSVPVLAIGLGAILLGEPIAARVLLAAALVLGGIALALLKSPEVQADRK